MDTQKTIPKRYIGLDVHKHYLIAIGLDADLKQVLGPQRVELSHLESWMAKTLTQEDELALEMTTNTWQIYDDLQPHCHSVTVVHPPHVALITRSAVMTDKISAGILARWLAVGLLVGIWVPPKPIRDLRKLIAQRNKMTRLSTQAKNRLHAVLHRHHILPPSGDLFRSELRSWWHNLNLVLAEKVSLICDLNTLDFARQQIDLIDTNLKTFAAQDDRLPLLIQLPGISMLSALTILAAIGPIQRFPSAKHLVGYTGLGARIHDSGMTTHTGRITKTGRKDLRSVMVEAAHAAVNSHPHWKAELARLEPHLGYNKAIVAIARKLLVAVWHVLTHNTPDRFAQPQQIANKYLLFGYRLGKHNRPASLSCPAYVRQLLDRIGLGVELSSIPRGGKKTPLPLPPSSLPHPSP